VFALHVDDVRDPPGGKANMSVPRFRMMIAISHSTPLWHANRCDALMLFARNAKPVTSHLAQENDPLAMTREIHTTQVYLDPRWAKQNRS